MSDVAPSDPQPPEGDWPGTEVRFERHGSIARCVIDRPERRNALTAAMPSPEAVKGFTAFKERRNPSWVPEDVRTEGRL